ncbi:type II secretion system secretin GspD [Undibacterium cyanobacteriorum]|uniref:Type II secretion system secretin GspD n=1 Tax=Undibacterium cyanobacteriorum TaxID=3073561 RepID=A0ABY9RFK6_9BURK|nr:type II secretion system secretin GspD [Undibacterium sp. 20NA77.5]WMW79090.1 type II secretion system secretin GspD [Undibacterium sp. 20NA77.5]
MNSKRHWRKIAVHTALVGSLLMSGVLAQSGFAQDASQNAATLNFVNADIESVVKAIGHYTGTTFVIDPRVKGQLTLVSEKPLTKEQAFKLLTANLRMQGFAVVTADGFSKVVPETDAKLQGGPTQAKSVKGDQVVTQVFRINYEAANNIVTALRPLISPNNTINVTPGNNSIVITDYADNMRRMAEIIALLDVPANPELEVIPIKHAIAADIATMANRLTEGNQAAGDSGRTIIMADSRTNSVLVKAPSQARGNLIKKLVADLDQPTTLPGNVHVVYLKNAEAVKLAATLRSIVTGESSNLNSGSSNSSNLSSSGPGLNTSAMPQQGNNSALTSTGSNLSLPVSTSGNSQGTSGGSGFIQADQATNTLIITASDAVYRNLRAVIDQLDARRAQVYIETLIVEVSNNKLDELGVSWVGASGDSSSKYRLGGITSYSNDPDRPELLGFAGGAAGAATAVKGKGLSIGLFKQIGGQLGLGALAQALASDGSTNVLSVPTLITLDNEEASIVDGKTVGFVTGSYTSSSTGTAGQNPFQTVDRKEIGIKLKVKPQISESGTVKLALVQEVSDVADPIPGGVGITTSVRSIATNVLAEDGEIVVLGGLLKDQNSDGVAKVPVLGDIPLLGNLFKTKKRTVDKTNLMVFLRPVVIRNAEQSSGVSLDRYDYLRTQYLKATGQDANGLMLKMEKGKLLKFPDATEKTNSAPKEGQ